MTVQLLDQALRCMIHVPYSESVFEELLDSMFFVSVSFLLLFPCSRLRAACFFFYLMFKTYSITINSYILQRQCFGVALKASNLRLYISYWCGCIYFAFPRDLVTTASSILHILMHRNRNIFRSWVSDRIFIATITLTTFSNSNPFNDWLHPILGRRVDMTEF